MKTKSLEHTTFVIERDLPGSPRHAFRFWSDRALKEIWNACHPSGLSLKTFLIFASVAGKRSVGARQKATS